jgi:hypothetical protein
MTPLNPFDTVNKKPACCHKCNPDYQFMLLCQTCGNKRCPHASDHELACTGSNDPGQPGSIYEDYWKLKEIIRELNPERKAIRQEIVRTKNDYDESLKQHEAVVKKTNAEYRAIQEKCPHPAVSGRFCLDCHKQVVQD